MNAKKYEIKCNPASFLQTSASVLVYRIFLSNLVIYLVAFDHITWKLSKHNVPSIYLF